MFTCSLCFIVSWYDPFLLQYSTSLCCFLANSFPNRSEVTHPMGRRQQYSRNNHSNLRAFRRWYGDKAPLQAKWQDKNCWSHRFSGLLHGQSSNCSLILKARVITLTKSHGTCKPYFLPIFLFWFIIERWPFTHRSALHESLEHAYCYGRGLQSIHTRVFL